MTLCDENWTIQSNRNITEEISFKKYEKLECLHQVAMSLIEGFKTQKFNYRGNLVQNHDSELKSLTEKNKQLRHDIDIKLAELAKNKSSYENYKQAQKLLSQEIKEMHEAFLMAKKYYKKFLKIYFTIESRNAGIQTIYVQFFTEAKRESENYSLRLSRDTKTGRYKLLSATPKIHGFKEMQAILEETNDVPGVLCSVKQAFTNVKLKKK